MSLSPEEVISLNRLTLVARLLAGTSHNLNNALMIISGSAELLAGLQDVGDSSRRAVDRIQTNTTRAAVAIQELMQFARDQGDTIGRVALRDVVTRAIQMRGFASRRAGVALAFDEASAPAAIVRGNSARLLQAVLNLTINGEQAVRGAAEPTIVFELEEGPGTALLRVTDNGRGLDPGVIDRAFDPFATTRPFPDSAGLGLAATRAVARSHGGDVTLEPRSPGCCAILRLPLDVSDHSVR